MRRPYARRGSRRGESGRIRHRGPVATAHELQPDQDDRGRDRGRQAVEEGKELTPGERRDERRDRRGGLRRSLDREDAADHASREEVAVAERRTAERRRLQLREAER